MLYIFLILIIILFIFLQKKNVKEHFSTTYYKCPKYGNNELTDEIFNEYNITRSNVDKQWDFYIPCGYNFVENELKHINPTNKNQKIFGINGCDNIVSKNGLWNIINNKYGRDMAKTLMPETFIISNKDDINLFKKKYNPKKLYLLKKNIQRKQGIKITNKLNEIIYNTDSGYKVIQEYFGNLYLVKSRKINLRIYLLVTCKNGYITTYIHRLGKCIYTNQDYEGLTNLNPEQHLTSLNLNMDVYKDRPQSFNDLQKYLGSKRYKILMENIFTNLILIMKAAKPHLCNLTNINNNLSFQLFGLDYVFNDNMYPYLLEMNKGPDMIPKNNEDKPIKKKVIQDTFVTVGIIKENNNNNGFMRLKI